ncbi:hypothetical protein PPERSA_06711 [Pseudocohnilembus persalinus]|uniref:C2H2-type domain-containing protein n=1 Tax=Pseudocohnilembus persalinus TaxID=266149 RepID=A0A0V0QT08_PSEPJ|nr:hypothetical protein PPERSA_06711 [Pseudocohnilembus persalinus]|eukprot:KRX05077.1 hypothetical protein PPERSA_06711 [Pseudocohnilembus persalinus]
MSQYQSTQVQIRSKILREKLADQDPEVLESFVVYTKFAKEIRKYIAHLDDNACWYCGKKFIHKYTLQTHIKTIHNINPHQCLKCNGAYDTLPELKFHIQSEHILKDKKYQQFVKTLEGEQKAQNFNTLSEEEQKKKIIKIESTCSEKQFCSPGTSIFQTNGLEETRAFSSFDLKQNNSQEQIEQNAKKNFIKPVNV